MFNFLLRFFSTDAEIEHLRNESAKVLVEYQKAKVAIADAKKLFEKTRENTIKDFENLKKNTFTKTHSAVSNLKQKVSAELEAIEEEYLNAKYKAQVKIKSAEMLSSQVDVLADGATEL